MEDVTREISPPTKLQMQADRLAFVLQDHNYQETIGKWLQEEQDTALRTMLSTTGEECEQAKGAYRALQTIFDRAKRIQEKRDLEIKKRAAEVHKALNKE